MIEKITILTEEQQKHYDSIEWLFFGPRMSGRTKLLAVLFIDAALRDIGNWVYVTDHSLPFIGYCDLCKTIETTFNSMNVEEYELFIYSQNKAIKFERADYKFIDEI